MGWSVPLRAGRIPVLQDLSLATHQGRDRFLSAELMKIAYGGVVIDREGKVLLRKPAGTPGGTLWTFAKGRPERGETMEATALREVLEETGIEARVVRKIPLQLVGGTSMSEFFLMVPIQDHGVFDAETEAVVWATRPEAEDLISLTAKDRRRIRDLQLLDESYALFNCLPTRS